MYFYPNLIFSLCTINKETLNGWETEREKRRACSSISLNVWCPWGHVPVFPFLMKSDVCQTCHVSSTTAIFLLDEVDWSMNAFLEVYSTSTARGMTKLGCFIRILQLETLHASQLICQKSLVNHRMNAHCYSSALDKCLQIWMNLSSGFFNQTADFPTLLQEAKPRDFKNLTTEKCMIHTHRHIHP